MIPSHDRSILLPAAPLQKPLAKLGAANTSGPASPPLLQSQAPLTPPPKERMRVAKWGRMLEARSRDPGCNVESWGIRPSKERKLRERTFKGIPDCWRSAAWDTLLCRFSRHGKAETRQLSQEYRDGLDRPSTYDVQIDLDVPRTISGHVMFRTRYGQGYVPRFVWRGIFRLCLTQATITIPRPPLILITLRNLRILPRHGAFSSDPVVLF